MIFIVYRRIHQLCGGHFLPLILNMYKYPAYTDSIFGSNVKYM